MEALQKTFDLSEIPEFSKTLAAQIAPEQRRIFGRVYMDLIESGGWTNVDLKQLCHQRCCFVGDCSDKRCAAIPIETQKESLTPADGLTRLAESALSLDRVEMVLMANVSPDFSIVYLEITPSFPMFKTITQSDQRKKKSLNKLRTQLYYGDIRGIQKKTAESSDSTSDVNEAEDSKLD